jgi:hypothetical protein
MPLVGTNMLADTGDRPYMCVLCRDTFSRSDILKRHFQKCSIRRGNPQGVSHLSHPQAHVKKNANAQKAGNGIGADGDVNHLNGMGNMPADGTVHSFGLIPATDRVSGLSNEQYQSSRSSDIARLVNDQLDGRAPGGNTDAPAQGNNAQRLESAEGSNNMTANINPQLAAYSMPPAQNGIPMFGGPGTNQQSNLDWSQMFPQTGKDVPQSTSIEHT